LLTPQIPLVEGSQNTIWTGIIAQTVYAEEEGQALAHHNVPGLQDGQ
jgi:hypothetical protein